MYSHKRTGKYKYTYTHKGTKYTHDISGVPLKMTWAHANWHDLWIEYHAERDVDVERWLKCHRKAPDHNTHVNSRIVHMREQFDAEFIARGGTIKILNDGKKRYLSVKDPGT